MLHLGETRLPAGGRLPFDFMRERRGHRGMADRVIEVNRAPSVTA